MVLRNATYLQDTSDASILPNKAKQKQVPCLLN